MAAFNLFMFAMDRIRTVLLALALIIMVKTAWIILIPVLGGN